MGDRRLKFVTLAGGTGSFSTLSALKRFTGDISLTAVVGTSDSGGSSGRLRVDDLVLPPGDFRQAMVALLPQDDDITFEIMSHRFVEGDGLAGHTMGNLMLMAFQRRYGRQWFVKAAEYFRLAGSVLPVSDVATTLYAELANGDGLMGEHEIDEPDPDRSPIVRVYYTRRVPALPEAINAIENADVVVIGPSDIYTSIAPIVMVDGIADALARSSAKKIYVVNLATKPGHTHGFTARRHCSEIEHYLGPARLDAVIVNNTHPDLSVVERYRSQGEELVVDDLVDALPFQVFRFPLLSTDIVHPKPGDVVKRSLIRHAPILLGDALLKVAHQLLSE